MTAGRRGGAIVVAVSVLISSLVTAAGPAQAAAGFDDVPADAFYAEAVAWANNRGVTNGVSANCFGPNQVATRAQFVVMLWRSFGSPNPRTDHGFVDVVQNWQHDAISWAVQKGIVTGVSADRFDPNAPITRGDLVTILHRHAGNPVPASAHSFNDVTADYHQAPVSWAASTGLTVGTSATTFEPRAQTTRAQIVTFLWRYRGAPRTNVSGGGGGGSCVGGNAGGGGGGGGPFVDRSLDPIPSNFDTFQYLMPAWGDGRLPGDGDNTGSFRFFCGVSHLAYDDPVIHPGEPGAAHLHMYFGNTETDAFSNYESLRTSGDGTCQGGPLNRSAYWVPTLHNRNGDVLIPNQILVYYKVGKNSANIDELPEGLMMLGGYDMATGTDHANSWVCTRTGANGRTIPDCPAGSEVRASVIFGVCWDGRLDSPNHRDHIIESEANINAPKPCPDSHPVRLPQFQLILRFISDGNTDQWYLSSDRHGGANHPGGRTLHADWIGAWDPNVLTTWTQRCVNARRSCASGEIGNGQQLSQLTHRLDRNATYPTPARPASVRATAADGVTLAGVVHDGGEFCELPVASAAQDRAATASRQLPRVLPTAPGVRAGRSRTHARPRAAG